MKQEVLSSGARERVAVYGSLREGMYNSPVMGIAGGKLLGTLWTPPKYTMYSLTQYPAVVTNGSDSICIEVYEVEDIIPVDNLEGYPDYYGRELIDTPWGKAWLYTLTKDSLPDYVEVVMSGDWVKYRNEEFKVGNWAD